MHKDNHIFSEFIVEILGNFEFQALHYFAVIATSLRIREITKQEEALIPTAGITMMKNDPTLYLLYNRKFTDPLNTKQLRFLFFHEIFHIILTTNLRRELHDHNPTIVNIVHDMVINSTLLDHYGPKSELNLIEAPTKPMLIIPIDYKGLRNYESLLHEVSKDITNSKNSIKDYLKSKGLESQLDDKGNPTGETFDTHLELDNLTEKQVQAIDTIANVVARGLETSNIKETIKGLIPKAKVDIMAHIDKHVKSMKGDVKKHTWYKRNRKMPGLIKGSKLKIVYFNLILDTSGSMNDENILKLLGTVMRNNIYFKLIQIDTKVQDVKLIKTPTQLKAAVAEIKGRGGTIIQPAIDFCKKNNPGEPIVLLTDGYSDTLIFHTRSLIITDEINCPISRNSAPVTQININN